jgi:DMSO/TMAO reductase YedYZ heme-binding membrane subunit/nitrite reductase/ring-hydroxylating ferredoxin subunit
MSARYVPVRWNRNKRVYDGVIAAAVSLYLGIFLGIGLLTTEITLEILLIRALGSCAILMLHVVLAIGPLARLDRRLLPLLYNRRHLGVATFTVALGHAVMVAGYYHGDGVFAPLASLLANGSFEHYGLVAFVILLLLAATSHDFWQKALGPSLWKWLHMLVYPAYALLVLHVLFGVVATERISFTSLVFGVGAAGLIALHLVVGLRERHRDASGPRPTAWIDVGTLDEIPEARAKVVTIPGRERVAVFKHEQCISAVTNVCAHQRGPLGEGKIVDGCITCPWHGWEYRRQDGCSPPPFQERIATYRVRVEGCRILLNPEPLPPGTPVEPAQFGASHG